MVTIIFVLEYFFCRAKGVGRIVRDVYIVRDLKLNSVI